MIKKERKKYKKKGSCISSQIHTKEAINATTTKNALSKQTKDTLQ